MASLGFKCTDENMMCRDTQYEMGKTYIHHGELIMCQSGYHFCKDVSSIQNYYPFNTSRLFIVEHGEECITYHDKSVTDKLRFLTEVTVDNCCRLVNDNNFKDLIAKNLDGLLVFFL
jgi:hypothetical protein